MWKWRLLESFDNPLVPAECDVGRWWRTQHLRLSSDPAGDIGPLQPPLVVLAPVTCTPASSEWAASHQIVRSTEAIFHSRAFPPQSLTSSLTSKCHNVLPPTRRRHGGRSQRSRTVSSATESAYFGSLKHCQSGFGNVGIAFVAVAPVAVVLAALAVFAAAAAGCIPQCLAAGH